MNVPGEFYRTLGQYVYGYQDEFGNWKYIGKGNFNRVESHIKTKEFNLDDCWIIAKNLEKFDFKNKDDGESFLLESFLINFFNPNFNSVSGHYKDCFVMAKFSELFAQYKAAQFDNFESLPNWYVDNYDVFKGRLNVVTIKSDNIYMESATREKIQMQFYVNSDSSPYNVRFAIWNCVNEQLEQKENELFMFLESCGYSRDLIEKTGNRNMYQISPKTIEEVISLFDQFMS
jgi:hypothetical protein